MRPYVILKAATSLNGFIDDGTTKRLQLSDDADLSEVNLLRSEVDAILVGANTVRKDNPSLLVKAPVVKQPIKITITTGKLIPTDGNFITKGTSEKWIYTEISQADLFKDLGSLNTITVIGLKNLSLESMLTDLSARGINRLLVEGGASIITQFLQLNLFDELRLAVSPKIISSQNAVPLVTCTFEAPNLKLNSTKKVGQMAVLSYLVKN